MPFNCVCIFAVFLNCRKFDVINPSTSSYDFVWSTDSSSLSKPFTCLHQQGTVEAGKKYQVSSEMHDSYH